jgi:DNA-directed RNA polymerase specialized sigma24 family protein
VAPKDLSPDLTTRLNAYKAASGSVRAELWEDLFPTLKNLARNRIGAAGLHGRESATELVVSLYPALDSALQRESTSFENRARFFGYAALAMRRQLVAQAQRTAVEEFIDAAGEADAATASPLLLLALERALDVVGKEFPRGTQAFMLRYYLGYSHDEILEIMSDAYNTKALIASDLTHIRKALAKALEGDVGGLVPRPSL